MTAAAKHRPSGPRSWLCSTSSVFSVRLFLQTALSWFTNWGWCQGSNSGCVASRLPWLQGVIQVFKQLSFDGGHLLYKPVGHMEPSLSSHVSMHLLYVHEHTNTRRVRDRAPWPGWLLMRESRRLWPVFVSSAVHVHTRYLTLLVEFDHLCREVMLRFSVSCTVLVKGLRQVWKRNALR